MMYIIIIKMRKKMMRIIEETKNLISNDQNNNLSNEMNQKLKKNKPTIIIEPDRIANRIKET